MQTESIINAVREAGIVGAGGAGFPSHVKLGAQVEIVIANGCECEPLLCTDQYLMEREAKAIIQGLLFSIQVTGAKEGYIAVKGKYYKSRKALQEAADGYPQIKFHLLKNYYPLGDEQLLTYLVTGRIVPMGGIPAQVGVLVHNVTTLAQIASAIEGESVTRRKVVVFGEVAEPKVLDVPIGTTMGQVIAWAGGTLSEDVSVIAGGPMMGQLVEDMQTPITKTTGALIVLPDYHPLIINKKKRSTVAQRHANSYCQSCGGCQILCPRGKLGHPLRPQRLMQTADYEGEPDFSGLSACSQCGVCSMYACVMGLSPSTINFELKKRQAGKKISKAPRELYRSNPWEISLGVPGARLVHRLGLGKYNFLPPFDENEYIPQTVRLPLKQHIGLPALPVVNAGDSVKEGDLLAEIPEGKLGARIHASIYAKVKEIKEDEIILVSG